MVVGDFFLWCSYGALGLGVVLEGEAEGVDGAGCAGWIFGCADVCAELHDALVEVAGGFSFYEEGHLSPDGFGCGGEVDVVGAIGES